MVGLPGSSLPIIMSTMVGIDWFVPTHYYECPDFDFFPLQLCFSFQEECFKWAPYISPSDFAAIARPLPSLSERRTSNFNIRPLCDAISLRYFDYSFTDFNFGYSNSEYDYYFKKLYFTIFFSVFSRVDENVFERKMKQIIKKIIYTYVYYK